MATLGAVAGEKLEQVGDVPYSPAPYSPGACPLQAEWTSMSSDQGKISHFHLC